MAPINEESPDCLKLEVNNISKDEYNYQTRDLNKSSTEFYRQDKSYISVPGSCDSIIEIQNNSLMGNFVDNDGQNQDPVYADIVLENDAEDFEDQDLNVSITKQQQLENSCYKTL